MREIMSGKLGLEHSIDQTLHKETHVKSRNQAKELLMDEIILNGGG